MTNMCNSSSKSMLFVNNKRQFNIKQMHESENIDPNKLRHSKEKVLEWLKSIQSPNSYIEYACPIPVKESDIISISSDSSEEQMEYSKNNSKHECTSDGGTKPLAKMEEENCINQLNITDNSNNHNFIKEKGYAYKNDVGKNAHKVTSNINDKQSFNNIFHYEGERNDQWKKEKIYRVKKTKKLPKMTRLTVSQLNSVPNGDYSEMKQKNNYPNDTFENIEPKSIQSRGSLISNITSKKRKLDLQIDDEVITISDEDIDFNDKHGENSESYLYTRSNTESSSEQLQEKEQDFSNKAGTACKVTNVFNEFKSKYMKNNYAQNIFGTESKLISLKVNSKALFDQTKYLISSDDEDEVICIINNENGMNLKSLENRKESTNVLNCSNHEKTQHFEENVICGSESEKTHDFEETKNGEDYIHTKNSIEDQNIRNIEDNINETHIKNNENDCVHILTDSESEETHNFKDNESESTKDFNDNKIEDTHNFEDLKGENTNVLTNNVIMCTFTDNKSVDLYTYNDNESDKTHSFIDNSGVNTNALKNNDITYTHNCMDAKSENTHIFVDSESDVTHDFEDQKAENTIDCTEIGSKSTQKFENYKQHEDNHNFTDNNIETTHIFKENLNLNISPKQFDSDDDTKSFDGSEKNKQEEFRKKQGVISQDEISTDSFQSSSDIEIIM